MSKIYPQDFMGPKTIKKARETKSGRLAACLHEILYNGIVGDHPRFAGLKQFSVINSQHVDVKPYKWPGVDEERSKIDVEKTLREIRDYLDAISYKEVIP